MLSGGGGEQAAAPEAIAAVEGRRVLSVEWLGGLCSDAHPAAAAAVSEQTADADWHEDVVTVMIRQLPRKLSQHDFLQELKSRGFDGLFDYLYFPHDAKKGMNVGYGFINFTQPEHADRFRREFDGTFPPALEQEAQSKLLRVHPASVQGYEANLKHLVERKVFQDPVVGPIFLGSGTAGLSAPRDAASAPGPRCDARGLQPGEPMSASGRCTNLDMSVRDSPWQAFNGPWGSRCGPGMTAWAEERGAHQPSENLHGWRPAGEAAAAEWAAPWHAPWGEALGPTRCPKPALGPPWPLQPGSRAAPPRPVEQTPAVELASRWFQDQLRVGWQ